MIRYNKLKENDIKSSKYYYFDSMINVKDFNAKKIKVDNKIVFSRHSFTVLYMKHQIVSSLFIY